MPLRVGGVLAEVAVDDRGDECGAVLFGEPVQDAPFWPSPRRRPINRDVTREEVQRRLSEKRPELATVGVRALDLFGSVARGEAGPQSDVDLLVDFEQPVGLFHFVRVQQRLEEILGCRVDLVMREAVKPQLRARIFGEAVRAT